jgi:hypothetical protein
MPSLAFRIRSRVAALARTRVSRALAVSAIALGAIALAAPAARAGDHDRDLHRDFPVAAGKTLRLDLRWGELHVEATDGDHVEVDVRADCDRDNRHCQERLQELDVESNEHRDALEIKVTGLWHWANHGADVRVDIKVPRGHDLNVDMGAGEIQIDDFESDLEVDLGAGEIHVRMPEQAVRDVELSAGVGDAELRLPHGHVESDRHMLIGGGVSWDRGSGRSHVDCHVGAGEVSMRLD